MKTLASASGPFVAQLRVVLVVLGLVLGAFQVAFAANIVWVSDNPPAAGFYGPVAGTPDDAFTTNILVNAGHNVIRYSSDNSQNVPLSQAHIDALNTNDLIIFGRSLNSGAFQAGPQADQWNTNITKPIIIQSAFITRASRIGWFTAESAYNGGSPTPLTTTNLSDPVTAYLFSGVAMNGNTTVDPFDEMLDQNTSMTIDAPQGGGVVRARSVNGTPGNVIVDWQPGSVVRSGTNVLAGYRMFFASGTREADGMVPNAGKDNLTPTGEAIFLRAVTLAINNGVAPRSSLNIVWVSDNTATGFAGPIAGAEDDAFVTNVLQKAGHNVIRFSSDNNTANLMSAQQVADLNTNDLIIIGRSFGSAAVQGAQGAQWNTNITKPIIVQSSYLTRGSRLGWFTGENVPDSVPGPLNAVNLSDPETAFLFGSVPMNGTNTADPFEVGIDRNTSLASDPPSPGGTVLARSVSPPIGTVIAEFPAGTAVRGGANILAGYRMFYASGSREPDGAAVPVAGKYNFTPAGEAIFLRAVLLAANNGLVPNTVAVAPLIADQPVSVATEEFRPVTFAVTLSQGTFPVRYQWYFNGNAIAGATGSSFSLARARTTNQGSYFVVITNTAGTVTSAVANLAVTVDTTAPQLVSVGSIDGRTIGVCFSEELDSSAPAVTETINYSVNGGSIPVDNVALRPDGKSVSLRLGDVVTGNFTVEVFDVPDYAGNRIAFNAVTNASVIGWDAADIGAPQNAGSNFTCDNTTFEVVGGGTDIWGTSDQFYLVSTNTSGDFDARVRVTSLRGADPITKAVLVARETTDGNSRAFHISVNPPNGRNQYELGERVTASGASTSWGSTFIPAAIPNAWMRITRAGNLFTGYRSTNGVDWIQMGQTNAVYPSGMIVGFGVTAHNNSLLATGTFSNFRTSAAIEAPRLSFARTGPLTPPRKGTNVTINWPLNVSGFVLQSKPTISSTVWTNVPGVVSNSITLSNQTGSGIFRLISQ